MNRLSFAFAASLSLVACGPKEFGSVCTEVPAPEACMTACDPTPGAVNACPAGFHCSADGKCDAQCTPGGGQCGDGYKCTSDGNCVDDQGPGSNGPDASCPAINFTPVPTTPSIGLVLDRSGSMRGTDIAPNRFAAMRSALVDPTTGVVKQLEAKAYFGSELYTCNGNQVDLQTVPRALNNYAAISGQLNGAAPQPNGGTPTPEAINAMVAAFAATPPPAGSPPVIVLATDGEPNGCNGQNDTRPQSVAAAAASFAAGIPVYVLAIAQNSQHFQDMANAGAGVASGATYYPVTNAAQLAAAFQTIINGVISCDLKLTSSIDQASAMNGTVTVNGTMLVYGTDWDLVGGNIIRLKGAACTALKSSVNPAVSATFPCGSVIF